MTRIIPVSLAFVVEQTVIAAGLPSWMTRFPDHGKNATRLGQIKRIVKLCVRPRDTNTDAFQKKKTDNDERHEINAMRILYTCR